MLNKNWYKLDNVGKFYSSIADKEYQQVFRYSITLKDKIEESLLQKALENTIEIFESFNVNLKKGLFWYYLEETNKKYKVTPENLPICFKIYNSSSDFLYRVTFYNKRINFEISHILSDGRGSIEFFKTLVNNYLKLKYNIEIDPNTASSSIEKSEDSFAKYYKKTKNTSENISNIYLYKGQKHLNKTRYLEAHLPVNEIINLAHKENATLTSLLVSVLIYSMKDVMSESELKKNIKIDIPVDLRQYFKSFSSKNYFGLASVTYKFNSREDTLEDVITSVNNQFKKNLTPEELIKRVNKMVAFERNILCRITPIFLKNIALKIINFFSNRMSTSCVSNIGKIEFSESASSYIENVNILTSTPSFQITICSFKNDLSIGISSKYKYNEIIKNFCNYFSKQGIKMTINVSEVD